MVKIIEITSETTYGITHRNPSRIETDTNIYILLLRLPYSVFNSRTPYPPSARRYTIAGSFVSSST